MSKHFVMAMVALDESLSRQEDLVLRCSEEAMMALVTRDAERARRLDEMDRAVDRNEVRLEEECLRLIALYAPVARDLRYLATVLKVNNDLERIADHACNVGRLTLRMLEDTGFEFPPETGEIAARVMEAISRGIRALRRQDMDEARAVVTGDEEVDRLDEAITGAARRILLAGSAHVDAALMFYRTGREIERMADLATNIAEDTIFLVSGEIVRHRRNAAQPPSRVPPIDKLTGS